MVVNVFIKCIQNKTPMVNIHNYMYKNLIFYKKNILVKIIEDIYEIIDLYQK